MKRTLLIVIFLQSVFTCASSSANPPSAIFVNYDTSRQELYVTVQHPVTDPNGHFIKEVAVLKNGAEVARKGFDYQTSRRNQVMPPFKLAAQADDRFKVIATCNKFGSGEKMIEVK